MREWARPFRLRLRDGRIIPGVEFPSGNVVINHPDEEDQPYVVTLALTLDGLFAERHPEDPLYDAQVEWADEEAP